MDYLIDDVKIENYKNKGDYKGPAYEVGLGDVYDVKFLVLMYREKGFSIPGGFYKGTLKHHKLQEIILVSGKMKLEFEDLRGEKKEIILECAQKLKIPPFIYHKYEVLEDCIFIETKAHKFDPDDADRYNYDDFQKLKNQS